MSRTGEEPIPQEQSAPRGPYRLLRAIDELRALDRAKRRALSSGPLRELERRLEAKAREVFRIADEDDEEPETARTRH